MHPRGFYGQIVFQAFVIYAEIVQHWKRPEMKPNPKGTETSLARNLLQTVFHWKMPDHYKWSDLWRSINPDKLTARKISCQLPCRAPAPPSLGCPTDGAQPPKHLGRCCCSRPTSSPALEAARSFGAVQVKHHFDLLLNEMTDFLLWRDGCMCACGVFSHLVMCFFNLGFPCAGVAGLLYKKGEANQAERYHYNL